jgi:hypothetical protein
MISLLWLVRRCGQDILSLGRMLGMVALYILFEKYMVVYLYFFSYMYIDCS